MSGNSLKKMYAIKKKHILNTLVKDRSWEKKKEKFTF